jgi:two-component system chemotaxis response regulator CheB
VIVDDSAFMRKALAMMLESDPHIKVVATARDGLEGIERIREHKPDIVTMDIEMPRMDGLTALGVIMKEFPTPVLMVSSLTTDSAKATLDALNLGAIDFIPKELSYVSVDIVKIKEDLIAKVKSIALSRSLSLRLQRIRRAASSMQTTVPHVTPRVTTTVAARKDLCAVVLAVSTGGPFALLNILPKLAGDFPLGIAVVQHMPPKFTQSLAERIDSMSEVHVKEAEDGEPMEPGKVLIAPGGQHLTLVPNGSAPRARVSLEPSGTLYRPCADVMMRSAVKAAHGPLLGVIMTGMGKDGLEGARAVKQGGGVVVAQHEESCVVYGMPKAVVDDGLADYIPSLDEIPGVLTKLVGGHLRGTT